VAPATRARLTADGLFLVRSGVHQEVSTDVVSPMVNGSFGIWQRGTGPFTANGAYAADMWRIELGGTSTISVSADTANVVGVYSNRCAAVTYTHGTAVSRLYQKYQDWEQARTKQLTFSCHVKSANASTVWLAVWDGVARTYSAYHTGGGAYERLSVTATPDAAGTTLELEAWFEAGTARLVYLDNAQWIYGPLPGVYWSADPAIEKARCQRYYQVIKTSARGKAVATNDNIEVPVYWQMEPHTTVTASILTAGTNTNMAATFPQLLGVDQKGARFAIRAAAAGDFSSIDSIVEMVASP
jgi:hypothetical protein